MNPFHSRLPPPTALSAVVCAAAVWVGCSGPLAVRAPQGGRDAAGRIAAVADSVANARIAAGLAPGLSLAVARGGEVVVAEGYGLANVELGVPAGPETVYEVRSLTKQFTAALVLRLVEDGRVALDAPVTDYLPDLPVQGRAVTVRHLLTHTSGLPDYAFRHPESPQWHRLDVSYEEMMALWSGRPFEFEPGAEHRYSNLGYYLLGEIVGRVTGDPWADVLEREILRPLGLDQTRSCEASRIVPGRARGYDRLGGRLVHTPFVSMDVFGAAGALCSTVGDLVRWTHLLHSGRVVSPSSLEAMTAPARLSSGSTVLYGFGLDLSPLGGRRAVWHGGARPGFGAYLVHYPEEGLTVALLMNSGEARAEAPAVEAALTRAALGHSPSP